MTNNNNRPFCRLSSVLLSGIVGLLMLGCAAEAEREDRQDRGKADSVGECGDGTQLVCEILPFDCPDGEVHEIIDGCFGECVDRSTCEPPVEQKDCGDGTVVICEILPFDCPDGEVHEVIAGCFGACVDPQTCEPVVPQDECGDGSQLVCEVLPFDCPDGEVREIIDGCFGDCVDPATCGAPVDAACQGDDLDAITVCATACADVDGFFPFTDCLGDECPDYFSTLDESGEDCMNCSFLRGEDMANDLGGNLGAGEAFLAGVNACASAATPE